MVKIISGEQIKNKGIKRYLHRSQDNKSDLKEYTQKIINEVRLEGDKALYRFSEKFENINLEELGIKVTQDFINEAYRLVDDRLINAIKAAILNIKKFHEAQLRDEWFIETTDGVKTGQILRPLESIGVYIPGGRSAYVSSVLMTLIPAVIAGVEKIVLCSPPSKINIKGQIYIGINPAILVAANECGVSEIFNIGSAWAISALTYGTETIPPVLKIVGPGNKYVNMAKILVRDVVAIDNPAGPSEVLIIADEYANPEFIAYDIISQVEHDPDNIGILICNSDSKIDEVNNLISKIVSKSKRKLIVEESLKKHGLIIKVKNISEGVDISNEIAPEHLQILTQDPKAILLDIKNAGAIFLGEYSPVPLGDYCAGTNHVLPTEGNAKTYSGLNTLEFMKIISTLECNEKGIVTLEKILTPIAEYEKFFGHRDAVKIRLKKT